MVGQFVAQAQTGKGFPIARACASLVKPSLVFGVHALAMAAGTGHHVEDLPGGGSHVTQGVTGGRFEGWDKDHGVSRGGSGHAMSCRSAGNGAVQHGGSCKALPERQERERRLGERACHLQLRPYARALRCGARPDEPGQFPTEAVVRAWASARRVIRCLGK
jgi:hypothetical protein